MGTPSAVRPLLSGRDAMDSVREPLQATTVLCVAFAGLVGILLGYDMGIISGALLPLQRHFSLSDGEAELFVGLLSLCALPGCIAGSTLADRAGRRGGMRIASAAFLVGNALMAVAWSAPALFCGRALAGFAMGLTYILAPLYVAEVSPSRLRGMLTSLLEVLSNVGILLGYLSGWACDFLPAPTSWRTMLGVGVIPPLAIFCGSCCFMLESPRWLASREQMDEAKDVLRRVVGPAEAARALAELRADTATPAWREVLSTPGLPRIMVAGVGVAFFSQATGCEAVMYYSGSILAQVGMARRSQLLATVVVGSVKTAAVLASSALVDAWGRRPLLLLSSAGMCLSMATIGAAEGWGWPASLDVAALCAFVVAFSLGFGPIVYVYNAEIYPQHCRSIGLGLAMGTCRVMSALVSSTFLSLSSWATVPGALCVYSAVAAAGALFTHLLVPETKGTTLEGVGASFRGGAAKVPDPDWHDPASDNLSPAMYGA